MKYHSPYLMEYYIKYHDLMGIFRNCCINLGIFCRYLRQHHRQEQRHQHHAENPAITDLIPLRDSQFPDSTIWRTVGDFKHIPGLGEPDMQEKSIEIQDFVFTTQSPVLDKYVNLVGIFTRHLKLATSKQCVSRMNKEKNAQQYHLNLLGVYLACAGRRLLHAFLDILQLFTLRLVKAPTFTALWKPSGTQVFPLLEHEAGLSSW